jgi:hypothetical protein
MNIEQLRQAINSSHSTTMTIRFIKADGTERTLLAKTNIKRFLSRKPNKRTIVRNNPNLLCVFDMESKSYKSFRLSSVTEFRCKRIILK